MSTRSLIGIQINKKEVRYIYCHWDGYPDYNGRILNESYSKKYKIDDLIFKGDISALKENIEDISYYDNDDNEKDISYKTIGLKDYFSDKYIFNSEYRYLYDLTNQWIVYDVYRNLKAPLTKVIENIDNSLDEFHNCE